MNLHDINKLLLFQHFNLLNFGLLDVLLDTKNISSAIV